MSGTLLEQPNYTQIISKALEYRENQVAIVLELTAEGATVPFIARYRKERTGNLDETDIRSIIELQTKEENLYKTKQTAINGIEELGKMTSELLANILAAKTIKEVEELYKPYKSKKKTKAMIAIEKGFQVVADAIKMNSLEIPEQLFLEYSREDIIEGAIEIIGSEVSANAILRHTLIAELQKTGNISASKKSDKMLEKLNTKDTEQIPKFSLYFDFSSRIHRIKPYQILALNRGENLGILSIKLDKDDMILVLIRSAYRLILNAPHPSPLLGGEGTKSENNLPSPSRRRVGDEVGTFITELEAGFKLGYDALFSSVENELRGYLSEIGEDDSIKTFQTNLQALLMTRPEYGKIILAIDPGYRAGCKMCIIDPIGNPVVFDKIFLHEIEKARAKLAHIFTKMTIDTVVVGNGTGCNETCTLLAELFSGDIFVVNESGASVYSASPIAQEEFPDLDSLDRGTVSIGRRYIDPLSELVKVPVGSIGVGMYQHDVAEKKLTEKLGYVVEDVVNLVGINVNNASIYVLQHISGIDKREAKKIYNHRPYKSRAMLQKTLSEKAYQLAIGFLRVPESKEPLDNTDIHPDQYPLTKYILDQGVNVDNFSEHIQAMMNIYPETNKDTMNFILQSYAQIGVEKRINSTHIKARKKVSIEDVREGDIFDGVVRNVVAFGAFIDIGLKNDGLVHVSQMSNQFVTNPTEIVSVGDRVKVTVVGIDLTTSKIQLSMKHL